MSPNDALTFSVAERRLNERIDDLERRLSIPKVGSQCATCDTTTQKGRHVNDGKKVICFEDAEGDILQIDEEVGGNGERYFAAICNGDEIGVLLNGEQQEELASLLDFEPWPTADERADIAERAADILRASGVFGSPSPDAAEVVKLAEWIAHGYNYDNVG